MSQSNNSLQLTSTSDKSRRKYNRVSTEVRKLIIDKCVANGHMSKAEASRTFGLPWSTVSKIVETYVAEDRITPLSRGGRKGNLVKLSKDIHADFLRNILDDDCTKTL